MKKKDHYIMYIFLFKDDNKKRRDDNKFCLSSDCLENTITILIETLDTNVVSGNSDELTVRSSLIKNILSIAFLPYIIIFQMCFYGIDYNSIINDSFLFSFI